ncbi:hypothetical protein VITFI_CDS1121 [Vitreoscilla filiformis]|uniref:Uncharacterized protein n=1 Tax=Vitreoscilla filiformis TaxID=63 RepID=A0A221KD64_VITFI|nr:hypothetical protein VITFI_CDS1121 [Vitreoscilla filiformis]
MRNHGGLILRNPSGERTILADGGASPIKKGPPCGGPQTRSEIGQRTVLSGGTALGRITCCRQFRRAR